MIEFMVNEPKPFRSATASGQTAIRMNPTYVRIPAASLIALGIAGAIIGGINLVGMFFFELTPIQTWNPSVYWWSMFLFGLGIVVVNILVVGGALQMWRIASFRVALMGAILACVPFLGPVFFVGIPFGIWAIAILSQKSTRLLFETGTMHG